MLWGRMCGAGLVPWGRNLLGAMGQDVWGRTHYGADGYTMFCGAGCVGQDALWGRWLHCALWGRMYGAGLVPWGRMCGAGLVLWGRVCAMGQEEKDVWGRMCTMGYMGQDVWGRIGAVGQGSVVCCGAGCAMGQDWCRGAGV